MIQIIHTCIVDTYSCVYIYIHTPVSNFKFFSYIQFFKSQIFNTRASIGTDGNSSQDNASCLRQFPAPNKLKKPSNEALIKGTARFCRFIIRKKGVSMILTSPRSLQKWASL